MHALGENAFGIGSARLVCLIVRREATIERAGERERGREGGRERERERDYAAHLKIQLLLFHSLFILYCH